MTIKHLVGAAVCAGTILGFGGTALAGEWNPNGPTPISPESDKQVQASACAFSGLEDGESLAGPVDNGPGIVQTPHYEAGHTLPGGLPAFNDSYNCVGNEFGKDVPGHGPPHLRAD